MRVTEDLTGDGSALAAKSVTEPTKEQKFLEQQYNALPPCGPR